MEKSEKNIYWWWIMYAYLLYIFFIFSTPFTGKTTKPSYRNFKLWHAAWIYIATFYHLPFFQSMGEDRRMYLPLFLTISVSSILFLYVFHIICFGLSHIGLVSHVVGKMTQIGKMPEMLTILLNCAVLSIACCVFYSLRRIFPGSSAEISPLYSIWAGLIGLYIVKFLMERLTGWAPSLSRPSTVGEQTKPQFLDMVPWYSGTSADLYHTVFNLLVQLILFLRFDMRMMQNILWYSARSYEISAEKYDVSLGVILGLTALAVAQAAKGWGGRF